LGLRLWLAQERRQPNFIVIPRVLNHHRPSAFRSPSGGAICGHVVAWCCWRAREILAVQRYRCVRQKVGEGA
jgi:hypothetical protein